MTKLCVILKWFLLIWGAVSLVVVGVMAVMFAFSMRSFGPIQNVDVNDKATAYDVRFVLNGCEIGEAKIVKVMHSHVSARSFTGDHVDAYAIKIKPADLAELEAPPSPFGERWVRGDVVNPVIRDATKLATDFTNGDHLSWFPSESELLTRRYYVWVSGVFLHGSRATEAELIFVRPEDDMVFYVSVKM